jgi:hypothetical protein
MGVTHYQKRGGGIMSDSDTPDEEEYITIERSLPELFDKGIKVPAGKKYQIIVTAIDYDESE